MSDPTEKEAASDNDDADVDELPGEFTPVPGDGVTSLQDEIEALPDLDDEGEPGGRKD